MVFATEICLEAVRVAGSGNSANAIVTLALQIIMPLRFHAWKLRSSIEDASS
jgi:hypothetical protein